LKNSFCRLGVSSEATIGGSNWQSPGTSLKKSMPDLLWAPGWGMGTPAKSVRIALGALIIKERLGTSDEKTVQQIRENPYLQYFLGFEAYQYSPLFDPSMFVYFRKRLGDQSVAEINEIISLKAAEETRPKPDRDDDLNLPRQYTNKGKLMVETPCVPADIGYSKNLKIMEAQEKT
jgi:transposase, IS5 family